MHGSDQLKRAGQILVCGDTALRHRLRQAAPELEALLPVSSSWPRALRRKLQDIDRELHAGGTVDETLRATDEDALLRLADEILDLIDAADDLPPAAELDCG